MSYQITYEKFKKDLYAYEKKEIEVNNNSLEVDNYINLLYEPIEFNLYDDIRIIELYY